MKNKFFGKNISPDCSYCENSFFEQGIVACSKSKHIKDGKCRAFKIHKGDQSLEPACEESRCIAKSRFEILSVICFGGFLPPPR